MITSYLEIVNHALSDIGNLNKCTEFNTLLPYEHRYQKLTTRQL